MKNPYVDLKNFLEKTSDKQFFLYVMAVELLWAQYLWLSFRSYAPFQEGLQGLVRLLYPDLPNPALVDLNLILENSLFLVANLWALINFGLLLGLYLKKNFAPKYLKATLMVQAALSLALALLGVFQLSLGLLFPLLFSIHYLLAARLFDSKITSGLQ